MNHHSIKGEYMRASIISGALLLGLTSCAIPKQPVGVSCQQFSKVQAKAIRGQSKAFQQSRLVCRILYDDTIQQETDDARLRTASGQLSMAPPLD